jgi:deoxyribonuclease V
VEFHELNRWDVSPGEAREIQSELASRVVRDGNPTSPRTVAGIDVSVRDEVNRAAVVVDSWPDLTVIETSLADQPATFPYVPGLLSFREAPAIIQACRKLQTRPDLVIVDGQGIAHPRRLGIASHIGLLLDLPTIGCAKSLLVGKPGAVGNSIGDWAPIVDHGETIGAVVRTRANVKPVYVSIGHRISLEAAISWVLACCRGRRLPEPQRQAHQAAGLV